MRTFLKIVVGVCAFHGATQLAQAAAFGWKNGDELRHMTIKERQNAFFASQIR